MRRGRLLRGTGRAQGSRLEERGSRSKRSRLEGRLRGRLEERSRLEERGGRSKRSRLKERSRLEGRLRGRLEERSSRSKRSRLKERSGCRARETLRRAQRSRARESRWGVSSCRKGTLRGRSARESRLEERSSRSKGLCLQGERTLCRREDKARPPSASGKNRSGRIRGGVDSRKHVHGARSDNLNGSGRRARSDNLNGSRRRKRESGGRRSGTKSGPKVLAP